MVSGNFGFLLSSKYPLKQVKDMKAMKETEQIQLEKPEIISPVFNLNKTRTTQKLDTGFYDGAPFAHPHTLVIVSTNQKRTTSDLVAQGKVILLNWEWLASGQTFFWMVVLWEIALDVSFEGHGRFELSLYGSF